MRSHSQEHAPIGSVCRLSQRMKASGPDCPTRRLPEAPVRWRNALQRSAPKRITQCSLCSMGQTHSGPRRAVFWDWGDLYLRGSRSVSATLRSFRSPRITYST